MRLSWIAAARVILALSLLAWLPVILLAVLAT